MDPLWSQTGSHHRDILRSASCRLPFCSTNEPGRKIKGTCMDEWWMNKGLKAHRRTRPFSAITFFHKVVLCHCWRTMIKHIMSLWKKKKRKWKSRAFKSKEDQGIFYMQGIHRHIHTSPFVYKTSRVPHQLRFRGRCQLLVHTIEQAKRVCPFWGN